MEGQSLIWVHEGNAAICIGDRKLVRKGSKEPWELYDLNNDRTEQNNISANHPKEVATLAAQWKKWAHRANVLPKPKRKNGKKILTP